MEKDAILKKKKRFPEKTGQRKRGKGGDSPKKIGSGSRGGAGKVLKLYRAATKKPCRMRW